MSKSIKERFTFTQNQDVTENWYLLNGLKDNTIKSLRVKRDVFTLVETGETIEMYKHSVILPRRGRTEMYYIVDGENIDTKVFKLVATGDFDIEEKLEGEAYFRQCLVKRLQEINHAKNGKIEIIEDEEMMEV